MKLLKHGYFWKVRICSDVPETKFFFLKKRLS